MHRLETDRLILRRWKPEDADRFAELNADPEVVRYLLGPLTRAESDALIQRCERLFDDLGYGIYAVEVRDNALFAGAVGLKPVRFQADFTPAVEVLWRLHRSCWGQGYATEAARAAVRHGLDVIGLPEIVSFAAVDNKRSRRVMERIGLVRDREGGFDHPDVPLGNPLRRHVLYRTGD